MPRPRPIAKAAASRASVLRQAFEPAVTADGAGEAIRRRRGPIELPGEGGERATVLAAALAPAALLVLVWLLVDPRTPDLAAQVYRVGLFHRVGFALWDEHWYAGHHLPGYSLLFPPLGALLGTRGAGALCVLVSSGIFALLLAHRYGRGAGLGAAAFAVAAVGDVWLGRLAFALGVALALGAVLAYLRGPWPAAALLAALAAAGSPVAGLLLGLAALTGSVYERSARPLLVLAVPAALVVLPLSALFPEGGTEPFPVLSFLATAGVALLFTTAASREDRLLAVAGPLYISACLCCLLIHTPVGSNIERYGVLLAAPLLLAARPRPGLIGSVALAAIAVWVLWGPVRETAAVDGSPATTAAYYAPVERFLGRLPGPPVRVEVPLTRSHWEAAMLAPKVSLARGWEKQIDERYDRVLLGGHLTAASYRAWLDHEAISYVALPDVPLDPSSAAEGRLIEAGPPFLRLVSRSRHWRIYAVADPQPIVSGPAVLTALGHDSFSLRASAPRRIEVRIHDTRYWTLIAGRGCVGGGPEGFTEVRAAAAGPITVAARFSLARALGSGPSCRG
ncbi:MAG TPA: hypothetical protein VN618_00035 [Solirubrobacteraceae bacterium]|nr:hypothetical protein [Solirubrobacteraceae bacterium]